jgi:hypothetical protein
MMYYGKEVSVDAGEKLTVKVVNGKAILESEKQKLLMRRVMCLQSRTVTTSEFVCSFFRPTKLFNRIRELEKVSG